MWAFESGVTRREKLALLRQDMAARDASYLLLTDLTDAAWTLELRGGDVACTPVFLGFLLLGREEAVLCAQAESFPEDIRRQLAADGVALRPYGDIYALLASGSMRAPASSVVLRKNARSSMEKRYSQSRKKRSIG